MTRVAGANTDIWTDIYRANRGAIAEEIARVPASELRARRGAARARATWPAGTTRAREDRRALLEADVAGGPVHELRLTVPNRPGIVAQVALELGKAGVNIVDLALAPAADMRSGRDDALDRRRRPGRPRGRADRRARLPGRRAVSASGPLRARAGPLRGDYLPPRGQVDLPPRRAVRRDGRRAGDRPQLPRLAGHALDARRAAEAGRGGGGGRPGRGPDPRRRPARPAGGDRRPARRGQLRHADAAAAGLAGRAARRRLDARRRRVDPAPPGRPDRRAADRDGRRDRGRARAASRRSRCAAPS